MAKSCAAAVCGLVLLLGGCASQSVTSTPRTAMEQLLLSGAVDRAVAEFDVPELWGKKVFVDDSRLQSYDVEYVKAAVRARLAKVGAVLVSEAKDAEYTAEASCGGLGNEYKESILGIPSLPMPGTTTPIPELTVYKDIDHSAMAQLLILVHSKGRMVASGRFFAKTRRHESVILFFRVVWRDDVRDGWEQADIEDKLKPAAPAAPGLRGGT